MLLEIRDLDVFYGDFHVLHGVTLDVQEGEAVALVGPNGHGKSTLLKAAAGLIASKRGTILFDGEKTGRLSAPHLVRRGLVYVAEERRLFKDMTVLENLELGAYVPHAHARRAENLELVFELYPRLGERKHQYARTLSGGEAQMLALGRGLMSAARMMLIDEPSLGLAPNLVQSMLETIRQINQRAVSILLVEQNESQFESWVSRIYRLEEGHMVEARPAKSAA
ncbi:MAG: ABC transporter ATP-binding protein [Geminicoccaceae bacterium]